jgi:pimeloyl-ACP methyl ester carboxylesterase
VRRLLQRTRKSGVYRRARPPCRNDKVSSTFRYARTVDNSRELMSGIQTLLRKRPRAWGRRALLVAVTGWGQEDDKERARAAGFDHHLTKPVDPEDPSGLKRNLRLREGRYYWHWDPPLLQMGRDAKFDAPSPLTNAARATKIPTLLLRGGRSRIVSEAGVREFLEMVPHAEFVDISGAHHMVAGDANDAFNDAVFAFADKQTSTQRAV